MMSKDFGNLDFVKAEKYKTFRTKFIYIVAHYNISFYNSYVLWFVSLKPLV